MIKITEHDAIHRAEIALCTMASACVVVVNLAPLDHLEIGDDLQSIVDLCSAINRKLKVAHAKYEHGVLPN